MIGRIFGSATAERGFAMILALLITVVMTLMGIAFLLMATTENRISENERLASQALYFAEAGARAAQSWFDEAYLGQAVLMPPAAAIDLTQRRIDDDGDPATPAHPQDGSTWPRYKQGVDLNGDGQDDLFRRPYRGDLRNSLMGTAKGPDMVIDESASSAARTFLGNLSAKLIPGYPDGNGGVLARLSKIEIYGPRYVDLGGVWTRYGMATVHVVAAIYKRTGASEQILARRDVTALLSEIPYYLPRGPLQAGKQLTVSGPLDVHWGPVAVIGAGSLAPAQVPKSHPRDLPGGLNTDLLWGYNNDARFAAYKSVVEGMTVEDPWVRYFGGGPVLGAGNSNVQPEPFPPWNLDPATYPLGSEADDHSNVFQNLPLSVFPAFDYDYWKHVANSRRSGVHYYVWVEGSSFSEGGYGPEHTFQEITDDQEGIFFFDTKDKLAPHDDDGDGTYDNLTPAITLPGGTWSTRGLIYLNAARFRANGVTGRPVVFNAPGEPFQDKNQDGKFDTGENWINLAYPATLTDPFVADTADTLQDNGNPGVSVIRNRIGPDVPGTASLWGILYTNGTFDASGTAIFYGSVVAAGGVVQTEPAAGGPTLYWDDRLPTDWPPANWGLPRVSVGAWETESD